MAESETPGDPSAIVPVPDPKGTAVLQVDEPIGERCEVVNLLLRMKSGEVKVSKRGSKFADDDEYQPYALVSKQEFDEQGKLTSTTLEINSPQLLTTLKDVIKYYPGESLEFKNKFTINDPYMMLVHHLVQIREYRETTQDHTKKMHIALLLNHLKDEAGSKGEDRNAMIASGLITFPLLWMIFKPGDIIHEEEHEHCRLYKVIKHGYGESKARGPYLAINVSYTSFDGINVGTSFTTLRIWQLQDFSGTFSTKIVSLSKFPIKFLSVTERSALLDSMLARGKTYLSIDKQCIMNYDGLYLYLKRPPWDYYYEDADYDGTFLPETTSGRVIIDAKTFAEEADKKKEAVSPWTYTPDTGEEATGAPTDDGEPTSRARLLDVSLCPSYVYGFSLEKKEWCRFFVDNLSAVEWVPNALDSLILPAPQKRLLQGLVTGHKFPDRARNVAGLKGKGLVVLLHGVPGSGKTLTAEMTAEHTHRALLNISTGELGSYQHYIEKELKRLLTNASQFQAIVLIDEADVFLEARASGSESQLEQNAMVAVFLRQLEYFQGIIFLTSNRTSVIDPAIKSRIHLALQYTSPAQSVRRAIWQSHLAAIPADEIDIGDVDTALDAIDDTAMNGREINNAIGTARTMAASEGKKLSLDHLKAIVEVWKDFESSLRGGNMD